MNGKEQGKITICTGIVIDKTHKRAITVKPSTLCYEACVKQTNYMLICIPFNGDKFIPRLIWAMVAHFSIYHALMPRNS